MSLIAISSLESTREKFLMNLLLLLLLLLNLFTNNSPSAYLLLLKGLFYKNINENKIKIFTGYLRDYSFIYNVCSDT